MHGWKGASVSGRQDYDKTSSKHCGPDPDLAEGVLGHLYKVAVEQAKESVILTVFGASYMYSYM